VWPHTAAGPVLALHTRFIRDAIGTLFKGSRCIHQKQEMTLRCFLSCRCCCLLLLLARLAELLLLVWCCGCVCVCRLLLAGPVAAAQSWQRGAQLCLAWRQLGVVLVGEGHACRLECTPLGLCVCGGGGHDTGGDSVRD
jgi:hypothetical protein